MGHATCIFLTLITGVFLGGGLPLFNVLAHKHLILLNYCFTIRHILLRHIEYLLLCLQLYYVIYQGTQKYNIKHLFHLRNLEFQSHKAVAKKSEVYNPDKLNI